MENETLDFYSILSDCGLGTLPANLVVKNIANLEEFYDASELIKIYNYCLLNIKDPDVLIHVIKY